MEEKIKNKLRIKFGIDNDYETIVVYIITRI